ncbi:MAG: hypothetical protein ACKVII_12055 [Planctomycetales bacterium]
MGDTGFEQLLESLGNTHISPDVVLSSLFEAGFCWSGMGDSAVANHESTGVIATITTKEDAHA